MALLLAAGLALGGCNTIEGMGEDLESMGNTIDQESEQMQ